MYVAYIKYILKKDYMNKKCFFICVFCAVYFKIYTLSIFFAILIPPPPPPIDILRVSDVWEMATLPTTPWCFYNIPSSDGPHIIDGEKTMIIFLYVYLNVFIYRAPCIKQFINK